MVGPLGGAVAGPPAGTTEVEDVNGGPPGGLGVGDPGAPTTNAKKHRRRARGRCQSWRSESVVPLEATPRAGR
jgi:hypothetical protein